MSTISQTMRRVIRRRRRRRRGRSGCGGRAATRRPGRRPAGRDRPRTTRWWPTSRPRAAPSSVDKLELESPARRRAPGGGRRAGRAARLGRRARRHAQPRPAPVRPGVLDRRPRLLDSLAAQAAPALQVGRARPRAGGRGGVARADRAGAPRRAADPAELPPARAARPARLAARRLLPDRRARSAATSTTSSSCPTAGSASSSATSPTRACRRRW